MRSSAAATGTDAPRRLVPLVGPRAYLTDRHADVYRNEHPLNCAYTTPRDALMSTSHGRPRRRRLLPEERRRQIVEAVNRVVAEYGVAGATVSRIAATAGVSEGTLYVYFASREEMLTAALGRLFEQMAELIDGTPDGDVADMLHDIARRHSGMMKDRQESFTSPWIEFIAAGNHAGLREAIAQTQTRAFAKMLKIFERGQAEGTIRRDVDARRLTWQWYTVMWAENLSSLMGLNEYIDDGHSAYSLDLMLRDALA